MRPYDVKTESDLLSMESDNHPQDFAVWSILHNGDHVSLHAPAELGSIFFNIPRDQFNAIVDWYMKDQSA